MKCLACGAGKDLEALEKYPFSEDGIIDVPVPPLFDLDCEPTSDTGIWKRVSVCHECFHKLRPDMWISQEMWEGLNPVTPYDQLPDLPEES